MSEKTSPTVASAPSPVAACEDSLAATGVEAPGDREALSARWLDRLAGSPLAAPFLLAFGLLLYVLNLGGYPIYTTGEPREAIRMFDIFHGGSVILPSQVGIDIPWKPPLMYWLGAFASAVAGRVDEWTVRMPSGLLAVGAILVCYFYVSRLFDKRSALLSALMLATTLQFLQGGTAARVDMTLTFFMQVAFFEFLMIAEGLTERWMLLYGAIAAAVLAKGPIGVFLPGLVALIWIAIEGRWSVISNMKIRRGALLVLVVAGGWYLAASWAGGMAFVRQQLLSENLYRLLPNRAYHEPHAHPFYFMELALLAGFLPWSPFALLAAIGLIREQRPFDPRLRYLFVWLLAVLVFYNLPQSKRGIYLLSIYPAVAAMTGIYLTRVLSRPAQMAWSMRLTGLVEGVFFLGAGGLALIAGVAMQAFRADPIADILSSFGAGAHGFGANLETAFRSHAIVTLVLSLATLAAGAWMLRSQALDRLFAGIAVASSAMVVIAHLVVMPALGRTLTLKFFTHTAMQIVGEASVAAYGPLNFDVAFYSGRSIPVVTRAQICRPEYIFCWNKTLRLLPAEVRSQFITVLISNPTRFDGTGRMLLLRSSCHAPKASGSSV